VKRTKKTHKDSSRCLRILSLSSWFPFPTAGRQRHFASSDDEDYPFMIIVHSPGGKQSLLFPRGSIAARSYRSDDQYGYEITGVQRVRVFPQHRPNRKPRLSLRSRSRFLFFFRHGRLRFLSIIKGKARLYARLYFDMPLLSPRPAGQCSNDEDYSGF